MHQKTLKLKYLQPLLIAPEGIEMPNPHLQEDTITMLLIAPEGIEMMKDYLI